VKQRSEKSEDLPLFLDGDSNGGESLLGDVELGCIVDSRNGCRSRSSLVEVEELGGVDVETEIFTFLGWRAGAELVEDVVVSFDFGLVDESRAFEEVGSDSSTDDFLVFVEEDLQQTRSTRERDRRVSLCVRLARGTRKRRENRAHLHVLSEPRTVVVPRRLGVSEGFHDRVGSEHLPLDLTHPSFLRDGRSSRSSLTLSTDGSRRILDGREVSKDELG